MNQPVKINRHSRIHSRELKMNSGRFVAEMAYRYAAPVLCTLSLCAVAGIVLGVAIDLRWLLVGMMILFVVAPMLLAFLFYFFGLKREAFVNTLPHTLTASEDGVEVVMNFGEESGCRTEFFSYDSMTPIKTGLNSAYIFFEKPAKGFLWIPVDAFGDDDRFIDAIQTIDYRIHTAKGLPLPFDIVEETA